MIGVTRYRLILFALILGQLGTLDPSAFAVNKKTQTATRRSLAESQARVSRPALPDQYFRLLEAGADRIDKHLAAQPKADLQTLESRDESWRLLSHGALSSRLQMGATQDRLSLGFNTFFSDLLVTLPTNKRLSFRFLITGRGDPAPEQHLNLQLCFKTGETVETATGKKTVLGADRVELSPADIGEWIRQGRWKLSIDPEAQIAWPIYPHNPYGNGPERVTKHAVARLTVPLRLKPQSEDWTVLPGEREISFVLEVE